MFTFCFRPAIDCLTVAQFIAGLALIPIAILAEVLSFRVPKNVLPLLFGNQFFFFLTISCRRGWLHAEETTMMQRKLERSRMAKIKEDTRLP